MGIFRTFDKIIAKASYDPELEKQMAAERNESRDAKKKFREGLQDLRRILTKQIQENKITPEGTTLVKTLLDDANRWLSENPDATTDEINDKSLEYYNNTIQIYEDDKGRIYHVYYTTLWTAWVEGWKDKNVISEDVAGKALRTINEEKLWYTKNLKDAPDVYIQHINDMVSSLKAILPASLDDEIRNNMAKKPESHDEVDKMKARVAKAKEDKEALEKRNFSGKRIAEKATSGVLYALLFAFIITLALFGASIASNMAIIRPVPIRIVCWIYGFVFFIPVFIYTAIEFMKGNKPYFGAYLIPLYMYDPATTTKDSFFERLVWYKENSVIHEAKKSFELTSVALATSALATSALATSALA